MKRGNKARAGAERRLKAWDEMPGDVHGNVKIVRHDSKTRSFIRPGSQNIKKTGTGHKGR